jgi:hypothetical protein
MSMKGFAAMTARARWWRAVGALCALLACEGSGTPLIAPGAGGDAPGLAAPSAAGAAAEGTSGASTKAGSTTGSSDTASGGRGGRGVGGETGGGGFAGDGRGGGSDDSDSDATEGVRRYAVFPIPNIERAEVDCLGASICHITPSF